MIDFIHGILAKKKISEAIVDVGGIGFLIKIPTSTYDVLGQPGEEVTVLTRLIHRDDSMELYGFATEIERKLFDTLIGAHGIGPQKGLKILSGMPSNRLIAAIRTKDYKILTSIPGLGKKTAEKICFELEETIKSLPLEKVSDVSSERIDAIDALEASVFRGPKPRK